MGPSPEQMTGVQTTVYMVLLIYFMHGLYISLHINVTKWCHIILTQKVLLKFEPTLGLDLMLQHKKHSIRPWARVCAVASPLYVLYKWDKPVVLIGRVPSLGVRQ